jgi:hypothetical protein
MSADPLGAGREHEGVEQFGAWSGTESVEACAESAFKLTGVHGASS